MSVKKFAVRDYINRREEITIRINEIADIAEKEKMREFTDDEKAELEALKRELNIIDVKIAGAAKTNGFVEVNERELQFDVFLREAINSKNLRHDLRREAIKTTGAAGMIPLTVNDIVKPLEQGLIMDKVGLPFMTGLAGDYVWPVVDAIEAKVEDEAVKLTDSNLAITKVKPEPKRVGVTISITSQTINQTAGVAYEIVKQQLPMAIARTLNKCMFSPDSSLKLKGPFASIASTSAVAIDTLKTTEQKKAAKVIKFAGELPTYKELVAMRALALLKGVDGSYMAYVMDEYTKAMLEVTPVDKGSGKMICEDNKIAGVPVFCTNYINTKTKTYIGFGCWGYEPCQGFGDMRFVIDPYTKADEDAVKLTLNADFAMSTLREEAFTLGECTTA